MLNIEMKGNIIGKKKWLLAQMTDGFHEYQEYLILWNWTSKNWSIILKTSVHASKNIFSKPFFSTENLRMYVKSRESIGKTDTGRVKLIIKTIL